MRHSHRGAPAEPPADAFHALSLYDEWLADPASVPVHTVAAVLVAALRTNPPEDTVHGRTLLLAIGALMILLDRPADAGVSLNRLLECTHTDLDGEPSFEPWLALARGLCGDNREIDGLLDHAETGLLEEDQPPILPIAARAWLALARGDVHEARFWLGDASVWSDATSEEVRLLQHVTALIWRGRNAMPTETFLVFMAGARALAGAALWRTTCRGSVR